MLETLSTTPIMRIDTDRVLREVVKSNVTVVIPTLNESDAILKTIDEVRREGYNNILVVDGYSTDRTPLVAAENGVRVIYQHGTGKAGAVRTALEQVRTHYALFMDGDCTYDPKDVWRLLNHSGSYDHVIGVRDGKYIPRVHRFGNWVISRTFSLLFGVRTTDVCSGMYLLDIEEARNYNLQEPRFVVEIELAAQSASTQQLTEVPITYRPRIGKQKLSTWRDGLSILSAAFGLARRFDPVLLYSGLAGFFMIPAALILSWVLLEQLVTRVWHSGWALVGTMFLLVAVQAFTLASVSIVTKNSERRLIHAVRNLGSSSVQGTPDRTKPNH